MFQFSRATALKTAAVISLLFGVWELLFALPAFAQGADAINRSGVTPPFEVMVVAFIFAIMRLVAAPGVWQQQRWGIVITLIATTLDTLAAVPGVLFAPIPTLKLIAIGSVVVGIAIIVLCLWRDPQRISA